MSFVLIAVDALILLYASAILSWNNRPASAGQWPGSAAARFASGLMLLGYGVSALLNLVPAFDLARTELLMQQLGLYAALPMLICAHLAERLGYHWSRQIWGRIFLVWCVLFELGRRNELLETMEWVTLALGVVTLALPWLLPKRMQQGEEPLTAHEQRMHLFLPIGLWILLAIMLISQTLADISSTLWVGAAVLAFNYAQRVSYRMAHSEPTDTQ